MVVRSGGCSRPSVRHSWGKLKIRVKSGHKAVSNGSGCGLSGFGRSSMSSANRPNRRMCSRIWGLVQATRAGVTAWPSFAMADRTSVKSATLDSITALATRLAYFSCFSCSTGSPLLTTGPPKQTQSRKSLYASILVVSARMTRRTSVLEMKRTLFLLRFIYDAADFRVGDEAQQEQRALDPAKFTESTIEQAFAVVCAELAQQHRWHDPSGLDRQHHLDHVACMCGDQIPFDFASEQRVDMLVASSLAGAVENGIAQAAHAWHQLDAEEATQAEDGLALALGISVKRVGLDLRAVFHQRVKDMDGFPHAAGDEAGEQGDVGICDVVVSDAAITAVADVPGADEIVLPELDVRAVGDRCATTAPMPGQRETDVLVDHVDHCRLQLV